MYNLKVCNLKTCRNNIAQHQYCIKLNSDIIFISYNKIIAVFDCENEYLYFDEKYWNYSKTTSRYLNIWIKAYTKETRKSKELISLKIASLTNLNE